MSDLTYRRLAAAVLVAHQRRDIESCLCGWSELGKSHADHVAGVLDSAGALRDRPPDRAMAGHDHEDPMGGYRALDGSEGGEGG